MTDGAAVPLDGDARHDIADVLVRYATGIDRRDWVLFRTCFTEDCDVAYDGVGTWHGADEITGFMEEAHKPMGHVMHRITNQAIAAAADGASARCYIDAIIMQADNKSGTRAVGYYDDELVYVDGDWRISRRHFTPVLYQPVDNLGGP